MAARTLSNSASSSEPDSDEEVSPMPDDEFMIFNKTVFVSILAFGRVCKRRLETWSLQRRDSGENLHQQRSECCTVQCSGMGTLRIHCWCIYCNYMLLLACLQHCNIANIATSSFFH